MIKIEPLKPAERDRHRCPNCDRHLVPQAWRNSHVCKTEAELEAFQTNRRVIGVRREMQTYTPPGIDKEPVKTLYQIVVRLMPEREQEWGKDGVFCSNNCAIIFAHAAVHAGFRRKFRKAAA